MILTDTATIPDGSILTNLTCATGSKTSTGTNSSTSTTGTGTGTSSTPSTTAKSGAEMLEVLGNMGFAGLLGAAVVYLL